MTVSLENKDFPSELSRPREVCNTTASKFYHMLGTEQLLCGAAQPFLVASSPVITDLLQAVPQCQDMVVPINQ